MLQIDNTLCSDLQTEIRKLKPKEFCHIALLLNINDQWKQLLAVVPNEKKTDVLKFNSDHITMIEQASKVQNRSCAEIFLEEWSTMGRSRPNLEVLLELTIKAGLYRAADYINMNILNRGEIERPSHGPAARVANLSEIFNGIENDSDYVQIEDEYLKYLLESNSIDKNNVDVPGNVNQIELKLNDNDLLNNIKSEDYSKERLELNNKTTKMFDDIQQQHASSSNVSFLEYNEVSDNINIKEEMSTNPKDGNPKKYDSSTKDNIAWNIEKNLKIPIFIEEILFSKENTDDSHPLSDSSKKMDSKECPKSYEQLVKNIENLNISSNGSTTNLENRNEHNELGKALNLPNFLTFSSINE